MTTWDEPKEGHQRGSSLWLLEGWSVERSFKGKDLGNRKKGEHGTSG